MKELFDKFKSLISETTDSVPQAAQNNQEPSAVEKVERYINYIAYAMSGEKAANIALFVTMPHRNSEERFLRHRGYVNEVAKENEKPVAEKIQNAMTELRELQKRDPMALAYAEMKIAERTVREKDELGDLKPNTPKAQNNKSSGQMR